MRLTRGSCEKLDASRGQNSLSRFSKYDKILLLIFLFTLPLANPWVRGDGVGYYAFGRSLLIEHDLDFKKDWLAANTSFRMGRIDANGTMLTGQYTSTGHLDNHFSIGPAILWSPFLIIAHLAVRSYDALGGQVPADGYSKPYVMAMALGTALYGFLAIWISFRVARKYLPERWAFSGALGIWFASSLPVYMYFNPSWSHAHSAFVVALFVWYWDHTRTTRTYLQWALLGLIAGLMMDVYYPNAVLLLFPLLESLSLFWKGSSDAPPIGFSRTILNNLILGGAALVAFLPTLITKKIIYGSYLNFGYTERWFWNSPALLKVCFSSEHGLFSWTPILALAVLGMIVLCQRDENLGLCSICAFAAYLYLIGCYQDWHGLASFGNRFFVSLTALFVLGLSSVFDWLARAWSEQRTKVLVPIATAALILWNLGLIFQWGTHLIPARGPVSWRNTAYNQVAVVPLLATRSLDAYFLRRKQLMGHIEEEDVKQLRSHQTDGSE
jgi:hypothetical protein